MKSLPTPLIVVAILALFFVLERFLTALCRRDPTHKTPRQSEAATAVAG